MRISEREHDIMIMIVVLTLNKTGTCTISHISEPEHNIIIVVRTFNKTSTCTISRILNQTPTKKTFNKQDIFLVYIVYLFRILPVGVVSKNLIGARHSEFNIPRNSLLPPRSPLTCVRCVLSCACMCIYVLYTCWHCELSRRRQKEEPPNHVYVYVCMYLYTYTYTYTHIGTNTIYIYIYIHIYIYIYIYA